MDAVGATVATAVDAAVVTAAAGAGAAVATASASSAEWLKVRKTPPAPDAKRRSRRAFPKG